MSQPCPYSRFWCHIGNSGYNNRPIRIENELGDDRELYYNADGQIEATIDEADHETGYLYQHAIKSLITQKTEPDGDVWTYGYDTDGDLTTVTDPLIELPVDKLIALSYEDHGDMDGVGYQYSAEAGNLIQRLFFATRSTPSFLHIFAGCA